MFKQKVITKKLTNERMSELETELHRLRSFIIGMLGKDDEGEYRPEFVRRALRESRKTPNAAFISKQDFLRSLS